MKAQPPIDEAAMLAELLKQKRNGGWSYSVFLSEGPMRRALRKAGWIETYVPGFFIGQKARRWRITAAGLERLVNVPGSGITRR